MAQLVLGTVRDLQPVGEWLSHGFRALEPDVVDKYLVGWHPGKIPDLTGKTALVTGANSGLGFETAKKLALNGAKVFMVARDYKEGVQAATKINEEAAGSNKQVSVEVLECELTSLKNLVQLSKEFKKHSNKLDILVNMAGVFYPGPYRKTPDGIEQTLGVNYFAPALMSLLMLDVLRASPAPRIVNMATGLELVGKVNLSDITGQQYHDSGVRPYGTSKTYMMMFSRELAARVQDIDVFTVQPGLVATPLHQKSDPTYPLNLLFKLSAALVGTTPARGAWSTLFAATEPSLQGKHFGFWGPNVITQLNPTIERKPWHSEEVENANKRWQLFEETQQVLKDVLGDDAPPRLGLAPVDPRKTQSSGAGRYM